MAEKKKKKVSASRLSALVEHIKVDHDVPVLERIRYPIIWERLTNGYRVQDLQPSKIDSALLLFKEYYIPEETLCRGVRLEDDAEGVKEYLSLVGSWLKDTQSLAAVEEGTGSVVGLLVGRVLDRTVRTQGKVTMGTVCSVQEVECPPPPCTDAPSRPVTSSSKKTKTADTKSETKSNKPKSPKLSTARISRYGDFEALETEPSLSRVLSPMFDDENTIVDNASLQAIQKLRSYMTSKVDILSVYNVDTYYAIYVLLVIPDHRGKGVAKAMIRSCIEMSKKLGCEVVSGVFTSTIAQNLVYKEGFKALEEMALSRWTEGDEEVFRYDPGEEPSVGVLAHHTLPPEPPSPPPPLHPPRRSSKSRARA